MARRKAVVIDGADAAPRHGRLPRRRPIRRLMKYVALGLAVVLVSGAGVVGFSLLRLTSSIETVRLGGADAAPPPEFSEYTGAFNILLVGSDSREGQTSTDDDYEGVPLNDVTMLLHVSEDHQRATVVSFPRDLVINFPACPADEPGEDDIPAARGQQLNTALAIGGLSCVAEVVSSLTDLEIPYAGLISFDGVVAMSSAVGGVPVCFAGPVNDRYTGLEIEEAGTYELEGVQALQFLRSRHGVGDGSDLARISSQQVFLSSLVRTLQSDAVLSDIGRLYQIAQVATQHMTLSDGFGNVGTLVSMARVLADIPLETMQFVQYPTIDRGDQRVSPSVTAANNLMELIANDQPINLDPNATGVGSETQTPAPDPGASEAPADPSASATPGETTEPSTAPVDPSASGAPADPSETPAPDLGGVTGQSAAQETCVVPYGDG